MSMIAYVVATIKYGPFIVRCFVLLFVYSIHAVLTKIDFIKNFEFVH